MAARCEQLFVPLLVLCSWSAAAAADSGLQLPPADDQPPAILLQGFGVDFVDESDRRCDSEDACWPDLYCHCNRSTLRCQAYDGFTSCMRKRYLQEQCNATSQCLTRDTLCRHERCECDSNHLQMGDGSGAVCVTHQSTFFTTTMVISVCVLFAAVAIGVVMHVRSSLQRRLYQQQYRRHCRREVRIARAIQRTRRPVGGSAGDAARTRRYSEQELPTEPPPPYVPIFHTRSSGTWGALPTYQEAVESGAKNEAFEDDTSVPVHHETEPAVAPHDSAQRT